MGKTIKPGNVIKSGHKVKQISHALENMHLCFMQITRRCLSFEIASHIKTFFYGREIGNASKKSV